MFKTFNLLTISNIELSARIILMNSRSHLNKLLIEEANKRQLNIEKFESENKEAIDRQIILINAKIEKLC